MEQTSGETEIIKEKPSGLYYIAAQMVQVVREPFLVLDQNLRILAGTHQFFECFSLREEEAVGRSVYSLGEGDWDREELQTLLKASLRENKGFKDVQLWLPVEEEEAAFLLNLKPLETAEGTLILLSFEALRAPRVLEERKERYLKSFSDFLENSPAFICTLRGPEHVFELMNDNYQQLIGNRKVLGKAVRAALPEMESQGLMDILDRVYLTGIPYVGDEMPIKVSPEGQPSKTVYVNFVYQPTFDNEGKVDGIFVHGVEVTEQVLARKQVEESEDKLKRIIDTAPVIIWITDENGHSSYLNENWFEFTGQNMEAAEGKGWLNSIHLEDRTRVTEIYDAAHEGRQAYQVSYRLRTKSGAYRWVLDSARPRIQQGEFVGMIGTLIDVQEEKLKEKLIREKEHRMRSLVEEATVATAVYIGPEMRIELANDAMISLWGKDKSVIGKNLADALPELEGQPFLQILEEVFTTGEMYWGKEDLVSLQKDEHMETGYYNFTYKALRDENGEIYGIMNMAIDVTENMISKSLLKEREAYFRQLADLMPEKVATTDAEGNFLYFNKGWLDYTGLDSDELRKWGWTQFIHPDEKETFVKRWQKSLKTGKDFEMELRATDRNGFYQWHLSRAEAVRDEEGNIQMWVGTNTEIQRIKEEEDRKEEFLKMVSHELKTPLTSIKGYVQLLLGLVNKGKELPFSSLPLKPSLERIDYQIIRLSRLISEILDISRIKEGQLELRKQNFDLNELVDETVQDILCTNTQHSIEVIHEHRCEVNADRDRIEQVLINLIINAIKYSPGNQRVEVRVRQIAEAKVNVSVKDWGIGIHKKNHKKIFKRFYRIEEKNKDTYAGFGIGLYLADEIIQRHAGSIHVKSEKGKGSEFSFSLALTK